MTQRAGYLQMPLWLHAVRLVRRVYRLTEKLPDSEKSGLIGSMRKCVVSIPAKIASATGEPDAAALARACRSLRGVVMELQTYVVLARQLRYIGGWTSRRYRNLLHDFDLALQAEVAAVEAAIDQAEQAATVESIGASLRRAA